MIATRAPLSALDGCDAVVSSLGVSGRPCCVCFALYGWDEVRGEKVYECSELGSEMPFRRPQDPKGSGAIGVVVEHGDEQAFTKLPADGEVRQVGDAHALLGHKDDWLERTCHGRSGQFALDAGRLGPQRPLLELSAGRKLVVQTGMGLEVVRSQRNTLRRQIGRG